MSLALLTPAAFLLLALFYRRKPDRWPAYLAFAPAVLGLVAIGVRGLMGESATSIGSLVYLDLLGATMLLLISTIGGAVLVYSRQYLHGDPRHPLFMSQLALIFTAVSTLVIAGNLFLMMLSWVAMSLCLHQLLNFRSERAGARIAARKKYLLARLGDIALVLAFGILIDTLKTANVNDLLTNLVALKASAETPPSLGLAATLIALTAVLKSAQFPTHGWLVEVMETPTPVSAVLHAGVVNAGGFLFLRFSDLMVLTPGVSITVAGIGVCTALIGGAIMLAQPTIKGSLAYSTVSQMGFMMAQCGLGAYTAAVVHLVGHSLYKAHAFLNSGNAVAELRKHRAGTEMRQPAALPGNLLAGVLLAAMLALYVFVARLSGASWELMPVELTLGAVFVMGVWLLTDAHRKPIAASAYLLGAVAASTALYFAVQQGARFLFESTLPHAPAAGFGTTLILATLLFGSLALVLAQRSSKARTNPGFARFHQHLSQGFYINLIVNRWLGAYSKQQSKAA